MASLHLRDAPQVGGVKGDAVLRIDLEPPIDDDAVEVQMGVEQRTEPVDRSEEHTSELQSL